MTPIPAAQLQVDIAEIKGQLCTLTEIKSSLDSLTKAMIGFREEYIREHAEVKNSTSRAHIRIDNLEAEMREIKKTLDEITKLLPFIRSILYVITGVSIPLILATLYWVWSLITHTP